MASRDKRRERKQKLQAHGEALKPWQPRWLKGDKLQMVEQANPGTEKLSEVLLEFLGPYTPPEPTEAELSKLLSVGIVAWNAAIASAKEGEDLIRSVLETLPPEFREDMRALIDELIRRKEALFAQHKRLILDYRVTMQPSGPYVQVISTLEEGLPG
jgi:hypothetical protein